MSVTEVLKNKEENNFMTILLRVIDSLVMAAFSANLDPESAVGKLARKMSTV